jgi:hypothetical protein
VSITSVVNLSDGLLGQKSTQQTQGSPTSTGASVAVPASALPQDQFTPSSLTKSADTTAQVAGLFSPPNASTLQSSGASLATQPATNSPATVAASSNASSSARAASARSGPSASSTSAQTASSSQDAPTTSTALNSAAPGSVAQQTQLNTLNNALAALGLSAADIQQIDQVASLINDSNPTAFASLAYQLESQAQNSAGPTASVQNTQAAAAGASTTSASSTSTAATPPTLQSPSSAPQSGSDGQSAHGQGGLRR